MTSDVHYAGFWVRFFAGTLDVAFLMPPFLMLVYLFGTGDYEVIEINGFQRYIYYSESSPSEHLFSLISYALSICYLGYFLATKQQATFGKRFLGIYVGNPDGSRLSTKKSWARALASLLTAATCGLGFLLVIFTKEKTSLHDLICNTRVFHGRKS